MPHDVVASPRIRNCTAWARAIGRALLSCALVAGIAPAAAYTVNVNPTTGQLNYWGDRRDLTVVFDNTNGPAALPADALAQAGLASEPQISGVTYLGLGYQFRPPAPFESTDITVKWAGKNDVVDGQRVFANETEAGTTTKRIDPKTGKFTGVTIYLNRDLAWDDISPPLPNKFHLGTAMLHEMVHALGNKEVLDRTGKAETDRTKAVDANGAVSLMFGTLASGETRSLNAKDKDDIRYLLKQSINPKGPLGLVFDSAGEPVADRDRMVWNYRFSNTTGREIDVDGFGLFLQAPVASLHFESDALTALLGEVPGGPPGAGAMLSFDDFSIADGSSFLFSVDVDSTKWRVISGHAGAGFNDAELGLEALSASYLGPSVAMPEPATVLIVLTAMLGMGLLTRQHKA